MELTSITIVSFVIGVIIGGVTFWFIRGSRASAEEGRLQGQLDQIDSIEKLLETAKTQFGETAKLTAVEALQGNNDQFLKLANENLSKTLESANRELDQRHQKFQELVKPLAENYNKLNPQIESLMKQNQSLVAETGKLSSALIDNQQAGHWGEVQLRKVVELAGMTDYCDFHEQETPSDSQIRPDLVVRLPEKRAIVIDAKASISAYMEAQKTDDPESASVSWTKHARAMQRQVDDLASKGYGNRVEGSLDFVVMFVPGDQFLSTALSAKPGLIEYAMSKRVAIATPASLISMLWAVANGWQQFRVAQDAACIKREGEEMHRRLLTFVNHYKSVGKGLESAISAYNNSVGSFDQRVAPQGQRFANLIFGGESDLAGPDAIDKLPRISAYATKDGEKTTVDDD